ncbi:hypothetical protein STZ1_10698 [Bacillus subtilis]
MIKDRREKVEKVMEELGAMRIGFDARALRTGGRADRRENSIH